MTRLSYLFVIGICGMLSACVSLEYGPIDTMQNRPYGYTERSISEDKVVLRTVAPKSDLAQTFWMQRVNELCPKGDAKTNVYVAQLNSLPNMFGPIEAGATMEGTVSCIGLDERILSTLPEASLSDAEP